MRSTLLLIMLWASFVCHAQSYKLFTTDEDLSSSLINHIYQDSNGMIWVATEDGLNRYDGAKFTTYKHNPEDAHSLSHNYVRRIFEDSKGHIYIGTHNGVQVYNPATDTFSEKAILENDRPYNQSITDIIERNNGEVWVAGYRTGKIEIDGDKLRLTYLSIHPTNYTSDYMFEDNENNIYISNGDESIYCAKKDKQAKVYLTDQKRVTVIDLFQDNQENIYIATIGDKGLMKLNKEINEFEFIPNKQHPKLAIRSICQVNDEELYIGTDGNGVKVYNINTGEMTDFVFENCNFNSSTLKVHAILKDNFGNLWFGLYQKGVIMLPVTQTGFKYYGHRSAEKNVIGSAAITSLCRDYQGTLWIGTDNDGIYTLNKEGKPKNHYATSNPTGNIPPITTITCG